MPSVFGLVLLPDFAAQRRDAGTAESTPTCASLSDATISGLGA